MKLATETEFLETKKFLYQEFSAPKRFQQPKISAIEVQIFSNFMFQKNRFHEVQFFSLGIKDQTLLPLFNFLLLT